MAATVTNLLLPWLRQGLAVAKTDAGHVQLQPSVNGHLLQAMPVRMPGPGDVIGLDAGQILRMEPPPDSRGMETTRLAAIEFDHPALPWLFTPQATPAQPVSASTQLTPWLSLVVVRLQPGIDVLPATDGPLPVLRIQPPAQIRLELPDLSAAWAWAHAQVCTEVDGPWKQEDIRRVLAGQPAQTLSRLICPRVLEPFTAYLACVVPTFESGRLAGLGLPAVPQDALQPAWTVGSDASTAAVLQLPVYHHWRFTTGEGTDFESVARRIRPCRLVDSAVGGQPVHIGSPGFKTGASEDLHVLTGGALQPVGMQPTPWPGADADALAWQNALRQLLLTAARTGNPDPAQTTPVIGPPVHGAAYAGAQAPGEWLDELNHDPRLRVAAGLGVRLVQEHQEAWVAQAWAQHGELQRANQLLALHQLVRWTVVHLHRRQVEPLSMPAMLRLFAPVGRRVRVDDKTGLSLAAAALAAHLPRAWMAASMVRLTAPRGALQRRFDRVWRQSLPAGLLQGQGRSVPIAQVLDSRRQFSVWKPLAASPGMVSIDAVRRLSGAVAGPMPEFLSLTEDAVRKVGQRGGFSIQSVPNMAAAKRILDPDDPPTPRDPRDPTPPPPPPAKDSSAAVAFRKAAIAHLQRAGLAAARPLPAQPADIRHIDRAMLLASTQPAPRMNARLGALLSLETGATSVTALPITNPDGGPSRLAVVPKIPAALASALAQVAPEWLLPGLHHLPTESVALLQTDKCFAAALMVGANHEMVRELLWRGFPLASPAVTILDRFWPSGQPSIVPIEQWRDMQLGDGIAAATAPLVMALRSELIRRFPDTLVYVVPALDSGRPDWTRAKFPDFHGTLAADLSYFGFNGVQVREMLAGRGCFVVLQQQPTAARFGVDDPAAHHGAHLSPGQPNAAQVAMSLGQRPFRLAIHARQLLGHTVAD